MRQWTVDAFAAGPFKGNPACVVEPFDAWPDDAWMQALAMENNQAETAYLVRTDDPARFGLRWFTPAKEAPLCGHATLAAAHVLSAELGGRETLSFDTLAGELGVRRVGGRYELDFPADPPRRVAPPEGLIEALGFAPLEVWAPRQYLTVLLAREADVRDFIPDLAKIAALGSNGAFERGSLLVAATADARSPYDVVSRFFAPGFGIPEDPATGSAHCVLAPLFKDKLGRATLRFHQAFPGRGGDLECEVAGDRVLLRGAAVTMIEGRLRAARP